MANQFGWMPGFLKKFLNLDDETPTYGGGGSYRSSGGSYSPPRVSSSYSQSSFSSSYTPPAPSAPVSRPAESEPYPARGASASPAGSWQRSDTPAFLNPRDQGRSSSGEAAGPGADRFDGFQTIGYGVRAYVRGTLPPQGVEQFAKEVRRTSGDIWGMYSRIIGDQIGSIGRIGKELLDAAADSAKPAEGGSPPLRRIKVMPANGNGDSHKDDEA